MLLCTSSYLAGENSHAEFKASNSSVKLVSSLTLERYIVMNSQSLFFVIITDIRFNSHDSFFKPEVNVSSFVS